MGIDPGLNITGYGVVRVSGGQFQLVEAGVVRSPAKAAIEVRLTEIYSGVVEVIEEHRPDFVALEQLFSHYSRPKTAILMGHARGVICLAAGSAGIPVKSFEPTKVKKVMTGNGHAPKHQMQQAVKLQLNLNEVPEPADVADALSIAICGFHLSHNPLFG
ncbi:crossover junction endodeoxyribonuclease RuvC [Roseiconus nitratireducens]|uniref:Crossover junction endodeoxyribonuclease RuvC n=1 Tax=Roseiconus nitratireducens TaxID=2605748 RepID=A0A5M6DDX5_9BACT|nr:crossover junction endodeoxyribonuclease RuvC [Roseiconus nitratireducens]KAA5545593.1 crossover junction endodeoxyribonuclease RuvC [Roseiconus nitratireducens]